MEGHVVILCGQCKGYGCHACKGTGQEFQKVTCNVCMGTGYNPRPKGFTEENCDPCEGTGKRRKFR